ncbi:MAG: hypothetical protein WC809_05280 [Sinimarinibacterium sp.]|jgi:hypothetical protein
MRSIRGRRLSRLLFLALLTWSAAAMAQVQDATERAIRLDQTIQALKDEVLDISRDAQSVENAVLAPEDQRVSIYVSVGVRGLLLDEVSVAIDGAPADVYHYDEHDARAMLAAHSSQRVLRTAVAVGPHRIRFSYSGHYADAKPDTPPTTGQYEAIFDKDYRESELEFSVSRASRFGEQMRAGMKEWRRQQ